MLTRFLIVVALILVLLSAAVAFMVNVGEAPYEGELKPLSTEGRTIENNLRESLETLTIKVGARSMNRSGTLEKAAVELENRLRTMGYDPDLQSFPAKGREVRNLIVDVTNGGSRAEVVLIGAHYDTYRASPGAHSSGASVAVLLEIARLMKGKTLPFTLRLAFLVNGEPPYEGTQASGAVNYAQTMEREGGRIRFALLLDSLGYFSDEPGSQDFPFPLSLAYPGEANFLTAFGTLDQRVVVRDFIALWNRRCQFPVEGGSMPLWFPGMPRGDHAAFDSQGFASIVLSDTGSYRHSDSGTNYDLHTRLDYERLTRIVEGLIKIIPDMAQLGA